MSCAKLIAVGAPELLAGVFIEDEDMGVFFLIEVEDECVAVNDGCRAFAELEAHFHGSEIFLPFESAIEVVGEDAARAEEGEDELAVAGRGIGGEAAVAAMIAFMRSGRAGGFFPDNFAGLAVDAKEEELVFASGAGSATGSAAAAGLGWGRGFGGGDGRGEEDPVANDDGGGVATSGDGGFPMDVFGVAEFERGVALGNAVPGGAAPLLPVGGVEGENEWKEVEHPHGYMDVIVALVVMGARAG